MPRFRIFAAVLLWIGALVGASGATPSSDDLLRQSPEKFRSVYAEILIDNNPRVASAFLGDLRGIFKSETDPELFAHIFARATELNDLDQLVLGLPYPRDIRIALLARQRCEFCRKPDAMQAWIRRYFSFLDETQFKAFSTAFLDWELLPPPLKEWLVAAGEIEDRWKTLDLDGRFSRLTRWTDENFKALMAETPQDAAGLKTYMQRTDAIYEFLDASRNADLQRRVEAAQLRLSGLEKARALAAGNEKLKAELAQAGKSDDLNTSLSTLGRIFDEAGRREEGILAASPASEGQKFDDVRRERVAALLTTALMHETRGTYAGATLAPFYDKHPLVVYVLPEESSRVASEEHGRMTFNEAMIQEFVKSKGRDIDSLSTDPTLLRELVVLLSPAFVHEATHHRQEVWAAAQSMPMVIAQNVELEAMQEETIFIIEKSRRDATFKKTLEEAAASSKLARESLSLAQRLVDGGPDYFREGIKTHHYSAVLSLDATVSNSIKHLHEVVDDIRGELNRRQELPPSEQNILKKAPPLSDDLAWIGTWPKPLTTASTSSLREQLKIVQEILPVPQKIYDAYAGRLAEVNKQTEDRFRELEPDRMTPASKRMVRDVPPPERSDP